MLSFLSPRASRQSDDTLKRRPRSSSLGVRTWNPPTGQSSAQGTDLLGMLSLNLWNLHIPFIYCSSSLLLQYLPTILGNRFPLLPQLPSAFKLPTSLLRHAPWPSFWLLLLRREWWVYVKLMDNEFRVNPGHLIWSPCKHIHILYK